jgi:polar amino acid transport system ATP-binding protein
MTSESKATDSLVSIQNVYKNYGQNAVLKGISLGVSAGEVVCLIGASGSGKTTLLRCINQLETIDSGQIFVAGERIGYRMKGSVLSRDNDRSIARKRSRIGMVFQKFNLFNHLTALENITLAPMIVKGMGRQEAQEAAAKLLESVGLAGKESHYPHQLSGGQQQRVAIVRAMAMHPALMLFDEPTSALDPELVGEVLDTIRILVESGRTMIIVTHEISFAGEVADRIVMMDGGLIIEDGSPSAVLKSSTNPRTVAFLKRHNA